MTQPAAFELPPPEFPREPSARWGRVARYRCTAGCGWHHDEPLDPGPLTLVVPMTGPGAGDVTAAITAQADARAAAYRERVTVALAGHLAAAHAPQPGTVQHYPPAPGPRPQCEFPFPTGHPLARTARFRCPRGCDWYRDERTDLAAPAVIASVGPTPSAEQVRAVTENQARIAAFWDRVNGAIEEHVAEAHPDAGQPQQ